MSTVANSPCQDEDERLDLDDDDDDDENASKLIGTGASSSSRAPVTPSALSQPSGLPVDSIAALTHDELQRNSEFMKYVRLVDILLAQGAKGPSNGKFFFCFSILR